MNGFDLDELRWTSNLEGKEWYYCIKWSLDADGDEDVLLRKWWEVCYAWLVVILLD